VRIVDAEHANPARAPEHEHVAQRVPQPLPVRALEVERIDVLVLLRRVLGVLDRPVGPGLEPGRVLLDPRVIRRGLERDVERDLELPGARRGDQVIEVVERPERGVDAGVAALGAADRPRAARIVGPGDRGVVRPLRNAVPIGWIGGRYTMSKPSSAT